MRWPSVAVADAAKKTIEEENVLHFVQINIDVQGRNIYVFNANEKSHNMYCFFFASKQLCRSMSLFFHRK